MGYKRGVPEWKGNWKNNTTGKFVGLAEGEEWHRNKIGKRVKEHAFTVEPFFICNIHVDATEALICKNFFVNARQKSIFR